LLSGKTFRLTKIRADTSHEVSALLLSLDLHFNFMAYVFIQVLDLQRVSRGLKAQQFHSPGQLRTG
jgi:hypothetical protein